MENVIINRGWNALKLCPEKKLAPARNNRIPRDKAFPLHLAGEGEWVEVTSLTGGKKMRDRLRGLGLGVGVKFEIIQNNMSGKLLIGLEGSRLFLGGGMAHKIQVTIV